MSTDNVDSGAVYYGDSGAQTVLVDGEPTQSSPDADTIVTEYDHEIGSVPSGADGALYTPSPDDGGVDLLDLRIHSDPDFDPRGAKTRYTVPGQTVGSPTQRGQQVWARIQHQHRAGEEERTPPGQHTAATAAPGEVVEEPSTGTDTSHSGTYLGQIPDEDVDIDVDTGGPSKVLGMEFDGAANDSTTGRLGNISIPNSLLAALTVGLGAVIVGVVFEQILMGAGIYVLLSGLAMSYQALQTNAEEDRVFLLLGLALVVFSMDFLGLISII